MLQKAMISSKSMEYSTPQDFFDALNNEFSFTLDPCSTHENCKCEKHYTIAEDGLKQDWSNDVVFMNPPYSGQTKKWIEKAFNESKKGATVVCLIVSATDRSYWHEYIFPYAKQIRFIRGRLKFGNCNDYAPFSSAVVIFSNRLLYENQIVWYTKSIAKEVKQ